MARLLFILALILIIWLAFRYFRGQIMNKHKSSSVKKSAKPEQIANMKPCAECGLHMPEDEMISKGKLYFCSYHHLSEYDTKNK